MVTSEYLKDNCNSRYWKLTYKTGNTWRLEHLNGEQITVRRLPNGKFNVNTILEPTESHKVGKMYFTYVCNPLVVIEMVAKQMAPKPKCAFCEKVRSFFKGTK